MIAAATEFIRSAAGPRDLPADGAPEIALVGRSNVGKSSLINALVGQTVARTSARPGKTRLVNIYRVRPPGAPPFYVMDLPGFGYARGGAEAAREFEALTAAYFNRQTAVAGGQWPVVRPQKDGDLGLGARGWRDGWQRPADSRQTPVASGQWPVARRQKDGDLGLGARGWRDGWQLPADSRQPDRDSGLGIGGPGRRGPIAGVVFAVDSRHPGLPSDVAAGLWLRTLGVPFVVAATKVDKLSQADRARLQEQLERTFGNTVLPVSATTGEGLKQLWKLLLRWISDPRR